MTEQVYDRYYDTVGNYHWTGVYSGEHIERGERMSRYIDADVVLSQYGKKHFNGEITSEEYYAIKIPIDYAQTADVRENVHGEWIEWQKCTPFYIQDLYKCSKCNESYLKELVYFSGNLQYRFCPNCGADMRKGKEQ